MKMPGFTADQSIGGTNEAYAAGPVPLPGRGRAGIVRPQQDCCEFCYADLKYCQSHAPVGPPGARVAWYWMCSISFWGCMNGCVWCGPK